jgi:hypothetical protein
MLSEKPETPLTQSLYLAVGAIATGTVIVATRYFQESSNRNLYLLVLYMQTDLLSTILKCISLASFRIEYINDAL